MLVAMTRMDSLAAHYQVHEWWLEPFKVEWGWCAIEGWSQSGLLLHAPCVLC